jgi:hypothetical protein
MIVLKLTLTVLHLRRESRDELGDVKCATSAGATQAATRLLLLAYAEGDEDLHDDLERIWTSLVAPSHSIGLDPPARRRPSAVGRPDRPGNRRAALSAGDHGRTLQVGHRPELEVSIPNREERTIAGERKVHDPAVVVGAGQDRARRVAKNESAVLVTERERVTIRPQAIAQAGMPPRSIRASTDPSARQIAKSTAPAASRLPSGDQARLTNLPPVRAVVRVRTTARVGEAQSEFGR